MKKTNRHLLQERIKETWNQLSDDEIASYEDMRDVFFIAIRKKHGVPRSQAEEIMKVILGKLDALPCEEAA